MKIPSQDKDFFGKLAFAAFDSAEQRSRDPREVARLAVEALCYVLRRAPWPARSPTEDDSAIRFGSALRLWPDLLGEHRPSVDDERVS